MKTFKNFFVLTILALVAASLTPNTAQAQSKVQALTSVQYPYWVFNAEEENDYAVAEVPRKLEDGRHVMATNKKNRTQVIAVVKGGRIAQVGLLPAGGRFKALTPAASPCNNITCFSFQIKHCYTTPWGDCICVCGAWITAGN
ncbi:MAG TPA: hypothetical protein PKE06_25110 [Flavilitoribacter sp.]|nr:hypothetical protein [Lewinella sp.]MCB9280166.1 hypothetical protein [Lewinellaceae bacterium]HMQ63988.1 hypothetical protein [Flavilitoribacter sp.]HMQ90820.1 hypothetical protein [Flavilitoribacter sp.]